MGPLRSTQEGIGVKLIDTKVTSPLIAPGGDGDLTPYALVEFLETDHEPIVVNLLDKNGFYLDDEGQVKRVAKAIEEAGFDIIPNNDIQFTTFTPAEVAVGEQRFKTTERKANA